MSSENLAPVTTFLREKFGPNGTRLVAIAFAAVAVVIAFTVNYTRLASQAGGMTGKDFMSLWSGGKALALGLDPYDAAVWRPLRASYGDTWLPDAICPFPAWTIVFFVPFSVVTTQMAGAVWMTLCEIALIAGVVLTAQALPWQDYQRYLVLLLVGLALFRPIFSAIANGQLAPMLFFLLALAFYLHRREHHFAAGVVLALQITKPNLTVFFVPLVAFILLVRQDWRTLAGLVAGGFGLVALSWLVLPGWFLPWLQAGDKVQVATITPTLWGLAHDLACVLDGPCYCLAELKAAELYRTVRDELDAQ